MAADGSAPARTGPESLPAAGFLLLAGITLIWGANWPAMKLALGEIPVWTFRTLCLVGGGCGLLLLARLGGHSLRVSRGELGPLAFCALFNIVGWHLFSGYGVSLMEAGRASIIAFTMPLWAALLSRPLLGEPLTGRKLLGLAMGLAGLALLIGPDLQRLERFPLGGLFMLGAAISWAMGTVSIKRFAWRLPTTVLVGWQLLIGALPISLGMVAFEDPAVLLEASQTAILATIYVIALPMLFCHWAYFTVVRLFPASIAAIGTLAIPVLGVFSSALVLDEAVGAAELGALVLVCAGLAVVLIRAQQVPAGGD